MATKIIFEKIFLYRGFTNSPIDIHEFSSELSHYLGPQALIRVLFKTVILFERCEPIKTWLHIILKNEILILRTLNEFLKWIVKGDLLTLRNSK